MCNRMLRLRLPSVRALNERRSEQLGWLQVDTGVIQHRLEEWLDVQQPTADELARTWCFCDTSC
jgi:hypothetical protein